METTTQTPSPKGEDMTEIRKMQANEDGRGNLAGFEATCRCGLVLRSSLRTALELDLAIHERWHAGTDRGILAPIPGPEGAAR